MSTRRGVEQGVRKGNSGVMAALVLGPMLRHVADEATVWVETDAACTVTILGVGDPTFCVAGHHYALIVIEGLQPGTSTEYDVALDGDVRWPDRRRRCRRAGSARSPMGTSACRVRLVSHRRAARAAVALELSTDHRGRGVDALYAYAAWMVDQPPDEWADLAVFLGDQVYADDSSPDDPRAHRRNDEPPVRSSPADAGPPGRSRRRVRGDHVVVRRVVVQGARAMVPVQRAERDGLRRPRDGRRLEHLPGVGRATPTTGRGGRTTSSTGLMTYWLYQHLGNLSPTTIREEGLLG